MPHRAYIGIGSNLGDRRANALEAIARVQALPATRVVRVSSLYESEPLGDATTWFVNAVVELETDLPADQLLAQLQAIEAAMGRTRAPGERWGARVIDLDVLLVDADVVATPTLRIPHPEMHRRRFVLVPLAEVAPDAVHPELGHSIATLLATLEDPKRVTLLARPAPALPDRPARRP